MKRKKLPKHYYDVYIEECVLCGRTDRWRERRRGKKPNDGSNYHYKQNACSVHFT
jgi:hypothetical protein